MKRWLFGRENRRIAIFAIAALLLIVATLSVGISTLLSDTTSLNTGAPSQNFVHTFEDEYSIDFCGAVQGTLPGYKEDTGVWDVGIYKGRPEEACDEAMDFFRSFFATPGRHQILDIGADDHFLLFGAQCRMRTWSNPGHKLECDTKKVLLADADAYVATPRSDEFVQG